MPEPHISDEHLDQYALGKLPEERLAGVEEHLLFCQACQFRLESADEFAKLFREAAVQPGVRSHPGWRLFRSPRAAGWTLAAAAALATFFVVEAPFRRSLVPPATVYLQSLRGPDTAAQIARGRSALLAFDLIPEAGTSGYVVRIVNPVGNQIATAVVALKDGRLTALVDGLPPGSYWVRIFRADSPDPLAEYGLRVK